MAINWADQEVKDRLLAAIIASFDGAINCREVARLYGGNATYNAIENFLRKPKAKAKELKAEAAGRDGPVASLARPRAPKTPTKKDSPKPATPKSNGVKTGRVTKAKKDKGSPIKQEVLQDQEDDILANLERESDAVMAEEDFDEI